MPPKTLDRPTGQRGRPKTQISFSDETISDEELANELRIYKENAPTSEAAAMRSKRLKASKRIKAILFERHREQLAKAKEGGGWIGPDGKDAAWIRVGDVGYITPKLRHYEESKKEVVYYPGGADKVEFAFQERPAQPAGEAVSDADVDENE